MRISIASFLALSVCALGSRPAAADTAQFVLLTDPSGLRVQADFQLVDATHLSVAIRNVSIGVPAGFTNEDQILTSLSWDFGVLGFDPSDPAITSATVTVGATSQTLNFSGGDLGPGADVGAEFGYANNGIGGVLPNVISTLGGGVTKIASGNLDGPLLLGGPQAGMVANPPVVPLAGVGAIQNEIVAVFTLNQELNNLQVLNDHQVRAEFGDGRAFITAPEPATLAGWAALALIVRRSRNIRL